MDREKQIYILVSLNTKEKNILTKLKDLFDAILILITKYISVCFLNHYNYLPSENKFGKMKSML